MVPVGTTRDEVVPRPWRDLALRCTDREVLMRRRLLFPVVLTVLALAGCSAPGPIELPDDPDGVMRLEGEAVETPLDIILIAVNQVSAAPVSYQRLYDVSDTGPEALIAHYDEWLTDQGWQRQDGSDGIPGSLGASWQRDGQEVVLVLLTLDGIDIAAVLASPDE